jgi:3-hydroxymyristoyl/3-hydroxydecanoyl-(acyl carrier protein) dehydratase
MAQTGGIMLLNGVENAGDKLVYFMGMNNVKFRRTVVPGDQLVLDLVMVSRKTRIIQMKGRAYVDGALVAEGDFMAAIVDRTNSQPTAETASSSRTPSTTKAQ